MHIRNIAGAAGLSITLTIAAHSAQAQGKVILSNDEWLTGNTNINTDDDTRFLTNSLNWFGTGAGSASNILIYTGSHFITDGAFGGLLTSLGDTYVVDAAKTTTDFSGYGAVFVDGPGSDAAALDSYVRGGGNLFVLAGTQDDPTIEQGWSNPFLNPLGLNILPALNTWQGQDLSTAGFDTQGVFGSAIFGGVSSIFTVIGNDLSLTAPVAGITDELFSAVEPGDHQLVGVYAAAQVTSSTPEPATLALLGTGLVGLIPLLRRRRDSEGHARSR